MVTKFNNVTPSNHISVQRSDINRVQLRGEVIHSNCLDGHILVHIQVKKDASERNPRVILAIPEDDILGGNGLSLLKGDNICISGWVRDLAYRESLNAFLDKVKRGDGKGKDLSDLNPYLEMSIQRAMTCIIPDEQLSLDDSVNPGEVNLLKVEGIISRVWEYGAHRYVRIAIYDSHVTHAENWKTNPHYLTVQFTHGKVGEREIQVGKGKQAARPGTLTPGSRIRVSGRFIQRIYYESLRDFLTDAKRLDLLTTLPNADTLVDLKARYFQTSVEALSIIQF